jgi:hypothetical protein
MDDCCSSKTQITAGANGSEAVVFDPITAPAPEDDPKHACISCKGSSRPVTRKTVLLMLKPDLFDRVAKGGYRFCSDPDCRAVYFTENGGATFTTSDLRERVGLKERLDPIPLCYCFGFEEKGAREEIAETGGSTIPRRITELIKQRICACPERNPSGACCLGEVNRAIKRLLVEAVAGE